MPDHNTKIWRYLDFTKFVSMLDNNSLYFLRSDKLDDPFEGSYTKSNIEIHIGEITEELIEKCKKEDPSIDREKLLEINTTTNQVIRELVYVNCWHINEYESAAMWKSYLKSDEGVAIQSSIRRLWLSLKDTNGIVFAGKVKYIDYERDIIPDGSMLSPFFHKRKSFEFENEFRAVLRTPFFGITDGVLTIYPDRVIPNRMKPEDVMWTEDRLGKLGVNIPVDLDALIEKIYISPTAEDWFYDLVKSVSVKYGHDNKEVIRSSLADNSPLF